MTETIDLEDKKEIIRAIEMDMEDLVEHREELQYVAQTDRALAAKMVGVFDAADEVLAYIEERRS